MELELSFEKWAKPENLRKTKDSDHGICWHQQVREVEINIPFSDFNNNICSQERKFHVGRRLKVIGCGRLLEKVMNSGEIYLVLVLTDTGNIQLNFVFSFSI